MCVSALNVCDACGHWVKSLKKEWTRIWKLLCRRNRWQRNWNIEGNSGYVVVREKSSTRDFLHKQCLLVSHKFRLKFAQALCKLGGAALHRVSGCHRGYCTALSEQLPQLSSTSEFLIQPASCPLRGHQNLRMLDNKSDAYALHTKA